jgi:glycosyltransferase involved in cell wall biosynthesis
MPLTSVLLPIFNGEKYIQQCIESILRQDADFELIIQDDASTDNTPQICQDISDSRVKYARSDINQGVWGAMNAAAAMAGGSILRLFSHDDLMLEHDLSCATRFLSEHVEIGLCFSDHEKIDAAGQIIGTSLDYSELVHDVPDIVERSEAARVLFMFGCISGTHSTFSLRRHVLETIGGFDSAARYTGDFMLLVKAALAAGIGYNRRITTQVRFHLGQTSIRGKAAAGRITELANILHILYKAMDDKTRILCRRNFQKIYGVQNFHVILKSLIRGDYRPLATYTREFGVATMLCSGWAWLRNLPARSWRAYSGRRFSFNR